MGSEHRHHRVVPGLINERDLCKLKEAVCIQVEKIYDSCKEKDCIEDARVTFCDSDIQKLVDRAVDVKIRCAEVVDVKADIEHVPFKRGFYTVDVTFYIKVNLEFFVHERSTTSRVTSIHREGIVTFDKKVILFGSEGGVKIFKSHFRQCGEDEHLGHRLEQDNLPISKVEVAEPIALGAKLENMYQRSTSRESSCSISISEGLLNKLNMFDSNLENDNNCGEIEESSTSSDTSSTSSSSSTSCRHHKRVVVTIGIFSIIKLVRYVQLLIPAFDFCYPVKQCIASTEENPCELFETIEFPFDEFFPPQKFDFPGALEQERLMLEEFGHHTHHTSETSERTSETTSESEAPDETRGHHHKK